MVALLSWVGFLIAGTTWVCSVLITISILTDPSLDGWLRQTKFS